MFVFNSFVFHLHQRQLESHLFVLLLSDSDAFDLHYGVGVLRLPGGMDTHKVTDALLDSTDDTLDDLDHDSIDEGQFLRLRVTTSFTDLE